MCDNMGDGTKKKWILCMCVITFPIFPVLLVNTSHWEMRFWTFMCAADCD